MEYSLSAILKEVLVEDLKDEDIINPSSINLRSEYRKLNDLLFSNGLASVPLEWTVAKRKLGYA